MGWPKWQWSAMATRYAFTAQYTCPAVVRRGYPVCLSGGRCKYFHVGSTAAVLAADAPGKAYRASPAHFSTTFTALKLPGGTRSVFDLVFALDLSRSRPASGVRVPSSGTSADRKSAAEPPWMGPRRPRTGYPDHRRQSRVWLKESPLPVKASGQANQYL